MLKSYYSVELQCDVLRLSDCRTTQFWKIFARLKNFQHWRCHDTEIIRMRCWIYMHLMIWWISNLLVVLVTDRISQSKHIKCPELALFSDILVCYRSYTVACTCFFSTSENKFAEIVFCLHGKQHFSSGSHTISLWLATPTKIEKFK